MNFIVTLFLRHLSKEECSFIYGGIFLEFNLELRHKISDYLKFILTSLLGVFLLMFPFQYEGEATIMVALLANLLTGRLDAILQIIILIFIALSAILTLVNKIVQPKFIQQNKFLRELFDVSLVWTMVRFVGLVLAVMTYFEWGPTFIWSMDTGGLIFNDLINGLFA